MTDGRSYMAGWSRISRLADLYLIALGSNQPHPLIGRPRDILRQAVEALEMDDIDVFSQSAIIESAPIGPSRRRFANAAVLVLTDLIPPVLLLRLQQIEAHFGRVKRGQHWGPRTLDLDIILWSGGIWADGEPRLAIPHPAMRERDFVLIPAAMIAPSWRDPVTGLSLRQLHSRLTRPKPLDPARERH